MIKQLIIGASALALATTAQAQSVNPRAQASQTAVSIGNQTAIPVQGTSEYNQFRQADDAIAAPGDAAAARAAVANAYEGHTNVGVAAGGVAGFYVNGTAAQTGISVTADGDKAAIDTKGDNNSAAVDQTGGRNGWGLVNQDGDYNQAKISQSDAASTCCSANMAYIQQTSAAFGVANANQANRAEINQVFVGGNPDGQMAAIIQGGVNDGGTDGIVGRNNAARIDQRGGGNIGLYGVRNDASIVQGAGNLTTMNGQNNNGYIQQGSISSGQTVSSHAGIQQGRNGDAGIYQNGQTLSRAFVLQVDAADMTADVVQTNGQRNQASVYQNAPSQELTAFVSQTNGSDNSAFVDQSGSVRTAFASLFQDGNNNVGLISQTGAGGASNATAYISQSGNNNYASIRQ